MKRAKKVEQNIAVRSATEPATMRSGLGVGQALAIFALSVRRRPVRRYV
jgi:hypothetical protein